MTSQVVSGTTACRSYRNQCNSDGGLQYRVGGYTQFNHSLAGSCSVLSMAAGLKKARMKSVPNSTMTRQEFSQ